MEAARIPAGEAGRLSELHRLGVLDTPPEERFDRLTRLAQRLFGVPIALLTLVDTDRQWFKSSYGLGVSETPRDVAFCAHAILQDAPFVVEDALADTRFADNPLVTGDPHIRFYTGQPLRGPEGHNIGTLCIIDRQPRSFSADELAPLKDLAALAEVELQLDLEQRRRHEIAIKASQMEERTRLLDLAHDAIMVLQYGTDRIQFWNRGAERLYGWSPQEALGAQSGALLRTSFPESREQIQAALETSGEWEGELVHQARDGRNVIVASRWALLKDAGGLPLSTLEINRDITQRKMVEAALKESEELHRSIFEQSIDAILLTAPNGGILAANPEARRLFGMSEDELRKGGRASVVDTSDPRLAAALDQRRRTGRFRGELRLFNGDGTPFDGEVHSSVYTDRNGQERTSMIIRDITDRKKVEAELRTRYRETEAAQARTRAVLDAASDGMVLFSSDQRIDMVNGRFSEFFRYDPSVLLGRSLHDLWPEMSRVLASPEAFVHFFEQAVADENPHRALIEQTFPVRRNLEVCHATVPAAATGEIGHLFSFRDVTREREVDRMKSEFISLVSHELRTPLTSIKGFADLLLEGEAGSLNDEQLEFLGIIKVSSDRLVALINDLLDISKIESGRIDLNLETLQLAALLPGVIESFRPMLSEKQQQLEIHLPHALPPVLGDRDRVIQVLTNLVSNAYKYTPGGGRIAVRIRPDEDHVWVDVTDTGMGLSEADRESLFTKFFRARNRATQEQAGTGLGLAITRSLVELQGGHMTVDSEEGAGSTFSFSLPIAGLPGSPDRP